MLDLIIQTVSFVLKILTYVLGVTLFFFSMKKCFKPEGYSKVKFFFLCLLLNPLVLYIVISYSLSFLSFWIVSLVNKPLLMDAQSNLLISVIAFILGWIIYLLLMFLFSGILARKFDIPNRSLVTFVYLMFSMDIVCSSFTSAESLISDLATVIAESAALFFLYHYDIKALSKITHKKQKVNWKLFVIPPSMFSMVIIVYTMLSLVNDISNETTQLLAAFTYVLMFIFIWAFYVIIKNINATNEANDAKNKVQALSVEVMEALAHTIDAKDKYTNGHSIRVAKYSRMIAEKMALPAEQCENVYYMGLLHDIGKIGVPNEIINKPFRLSDAEYDIIKTHPGIGYDILSEIKSNPELAKGARWHHERYDGRGYPDKISGEDIPIESRIIAVADSYDAMTSNRSYRRYLPQENVRAEIEANIGTQFDPNAAKCMLAIIDEDTEYVLHE